MDKVVSAGKFEALKTELEATKKQRTAQKAAKRVSKLTGCENQETNENFVIWLKKMSSS